MEKKEICIIGLGPKGLTVLERLISHAKKEDYSGKMVINLIEPGIIGLGIYNLKQPDFWLLNTVCSQITMFPDNTTVNSPFIKGPSLYEWVNKEGYKISNDGFSISKTEGRNIERDDFLPRRLLGEYLRFFFEKITKDLPQNIILNEYNVAAIDIKNIGNNKEMVILENNSYLIVDGVILTTGHTTNQSTYPFIKFENIEETNYVK